jgi:hypothetical protein
MSAVPQIPGIPRPLKEGDPAAEPIRCSDMERRLRRMALLAKFTDKLVRIPGTDVKIGLDAIVGAVPVAGDAAMFALSLVLIRDAHKLGVPPAIIRKMVANAVLDASIGAVPFVGDLFDLVYRANERNLRLVEGHVGRFDAPIMDIRR